MDGRAGERPKAAGERARTASERPEPAGRSWGRTSTRSYEALVDRSLGIPRLEFRVHRLSAAYRFTYAFHAREVRFERDVGDGYERAFPETFSFHADRHDPAELYLRLEDLYTNPARLAPGATRRDAEEMVLRLLEVLPAYLAEILAKLSETEENAPFVRATEDVAVMTQVALRFIADKGLSAEARLRGSSFHLVWLRLHSLSTVLEQRVSEEDLERYAAGDLEAERSADPYDVGFFRALSEDDDGRLCAVLIGATEAAYHGWLEDVCLDEDNRAFERESSPFREREVEVLDAVAVSDSGMVDHTRDLSPFLRRVGSRDCSRLLKKLEIWFLRQYDIHHSAAMIHHEAALANGSADPDRTLSRHSTHNYTLGLLGGMAPFVAAIFAYDRAPFAFDLIFTGYVAVAVVTAIWFLVVRFMWKKDLTFFHASIPRIGAGIIVGYLPVFLIDEVWDLAEQALFYLVVVIMLLGSTTLLYLYVEVQRRLGDPKVAFSRALDVFLLGLIEAAGFGLLVTSLLGPLMVVRNWGPAGSSATLVELGQGLEPFAGQLPRIVGLEFAPLFPTAVLLMTFLSFFIGTFLQLLWEELPITEPL